MHGPRWTGTCCRPALVLAACGIAGAASAAWDLTSVEDVRSFGVSSLRFDSSGNPAIAFGASALYLATWNGSAWALEVVAPACGAEHGPALAFEPGAPGGVPVISYHDLGDTLQLARRSAGNWTTESIDPAVVVDGATSIALDSLGRPAVAYHDATSDDLRYAAFNGTSWSVTTVDSTGKVGEYASLAFSPAGRPAISYYDRDNRALKLALFDGASWQLQVVDSGFDDGKWSSLAFSPAGNPAISYLEGNDVKFALWSGTAWSAEPVDFTSNPSGTSLAFDGSGTPVVAYFRENGGIAGAHVWYAARGATGWNRQMADPQFHAGYLPSLAIDPSGSPAISYPDFENLTLKLTRWNGTIFVPEQVVDGGPFPAASLAHGPSGQPAVSFYQGALGGLRLGRYDGAAWAVESVDSSFGVGQDSSLSFEPAGKPIIAYDDRIRGFLKLARWDGARWALEVVDGPGVDPTAPIAPALALDPAGNPAVAYHWWDGSSSFALKLARFNGSAWGLDTIDSGLPFEFYASRSLAFDPAGNPAVAYRTSPPFAAAVTFALGTGTGWNRQPVESAASVNFGPPSLGFDGAGNPAVAYSADTINGPEVHVARRSGTTWRIDVLAQATAGTLAIDPAGNPVVSIQSVTGQEARLASWDGTQWTFEPIAAATAAGPLAIDAAGDLATVFQALSGCYAPEVAIRVPVTTFVHRGVVAALVPGWQAQSLPLTAANDDQTPPYPEGVTPPGTLADATVPSAPLVLYRVLRGGSTDTGNVLRLTRTAGVPGVMLAF